MEAFVVTGREAILARSEHLEELALRCGQPGAMHGLGLLLDSRFAVRKRPCLVGFHDSPSRGDGQPPALHAAVLLLEYCVAGVGTGLFATADSFGVRTVVAPPELRTNVAKAAMQTVLRRGARLVLVTFKLTGHPSQDSALAASSDRSYLYAIQRRTVQDTLLMRETLDATLATLGKRTRVHMRAARRRWENMFPATVLDDALPALASYDAGMLRQLNGTCLDPIVQDDFDHQVRSVQGSGSFAVGLRDGARWLAIVAGWRQGDVTWVEWQINSAGYEKLSLGSVLRTYLLESESARGTQRLGFHGGTSHSMVHSFVHDDVYDMLGRRPGVLTALIVACARAVYSLLPRFRNRGNFLLDALAVERQVWFDRNGQESSS